MYWVDRSTGEIVSERDKNKPLCAYYEYLRGFGDGVIIETYIIGENPFCRIDFAYCAGEMYVNLKRDYHFKKHGVDKNNVRLDAISVPPKEYDEKIAKLKRGVEKRNGKNDRKI